MHVPIIPIIVCFEGGNDLTVHKLVCALIMNVGLAEANRSKKFTCYRLDIKYN